MPINFRNLKNIKRQHKEASEIFQKRQDLKVKINDQNLEIERLQRDIEELQSKLIGINGIGRCVSNWCLTCQYAITAGEGIHRRAYACMREYVCKDYIPVN